MKKSTAKKERVLVYTIECDRCGFVFTSIEGKGIAYNKDGGRILCGRCGHMIAVMRPDGHTTFNAYEGFLDK